MADKERDVLDVIKALAAKPGTAIAFGGGRDSAVLLHMARRASGGKVSLPAVTLDPPKAYTQLWYFIDKLALLWDFEPVRLAGATGAGNEVYPGLGSLSVAAGKLGYSRILTGLRSAEYGVGAGFAQEFTTGGVTVISPLAEFTDEDIWSYIKEHNVPHCSLYRSGYTKLDCLTGTNAVHGDVSVAETSDDEELKARLKALGYM